MIQIVVTYYRNMAVISNHATKDSLNTVLTVQFKTIFSLLSISSITI